MSSVLEMMNYTAPYEGNFLASIRALAGALHADGKETVLVFPQSAASRPWAAALQNEYPVYFLPDGTMAAARLLRQIIRRHDVVCVHSHFVDSHFYIPLRLACLGRGIAHVYHAHSMPHFSAGNMALRRQLICAQRILCVSKAVRDAYTAAGFSGCVIVPNGVDLARLRQAEPLACRKPLVLMFGRDFGIKGTDDALRAFARYDVSHRFTLGICVAGQMEQARAALCARYGDVPEWVELLPARTDVGTYYRAADVFLSASRTEGMPYAVLEAAACDLPIALSDIGPHRLLGLPHVQWFPPQDAQALYEAVCRAIESSDGQENAAYVCERFSMQTWTQAVCTQLFPGKERSA